ncbi:MAG: trehalose-phosphatase [Gemmatimonadales bacterium]|jgi:alpha,alpha-trehalase
MSGSGHAQGKRTASELPSALGSWEEIAGALEHKRPAVFLDYDGTLTPIVSQPEDALLSEGMRSVLSDLGTLCTVAIVSGRDRNDVEPLVGLEGLVYAGSHGFDIKGPDGLRLEHEGGRKCLPDLEQAEAELGARLSSVAGARVERKRFAIANHYRNVGESDVPRVEQAVSEVAALHERLRISGGKKVLELRPDIQWDKGRAVVWLLEALGLDGGGVLPLYVGDDVTDEDAFEVLATRGVGVLVGSPDYKTNATYGLRDTAEVQRFLLELINWLRG